MAASEHTLNSVNSIALYQLVYYQIVSISKVKLGTAPEIKNNFVTIQNLNFEIFNQFNTTEKPLLLLVLDFGEMSQNIL